MRNFPAFRLGGQVFLLSGILCLFAPFSHDLRLFWLLSGLILLAALPACRITRPLPRIALALLPAAALPTPCESTVSLVAAAVILLYAAAVMGFGLFWPEDWFYRREGAWTLGLCGIGAVCYFAMDDCEIAALWMMICAALLVLLALRALQISGSMGAAWQARSIGLLAAVLGLGLLAALILWAGAPIFIRPVIWLAEGFSYLVTLLIYFFMWWRHALLVAFGTDDHALDARLPKLSLYSDDPAKSGSQSGADAQMQPLEIHIPLLQILVVLLVLALLIVLVVLLLSGRIKLRRRLPTQTANGTEASDRVVRRRKAKQPPATNREQVRYLYDSYLRYLRSRNVRLSGCDTTAEISEASSELFVQTDERFRSLYRKARYSTEPLSDEDLSAARECFERLLATENLRE